MTSFKLMSLICGHLTVSKQVVNGDLYYSSMLVGKNKLQLGKDLGNSDFLTSQRNLMYLTVKVGDIM